MNNQRIQNLASGNLEQNLSTQVCIIGGGVAGQTLAIQLEKHNIASLIIESGDKDTNAETQALAKGANGGENYYDLETARLRLFGGTAAIWGGRCAELDPIDFEARDYIPHSGWPITKSDLDPYYAQSFESLGLKRPSEGRLWKTINLKPPAFDPKKIDTDLWAFDENGERFTNLNRKGLEKTRIVLNANLTDIDVNEQGEVQTISVKSLNGHTAQINAKYFVLAAGAIETVRLLLAAVAKRPDGLGQEKDQLGRFFMEHPHARGGEILPVSLAQTLQVLPRALRVDGRRYAAYLRPSPEVQRQLGILNTSVSFAPRRHANEKEENYRSAIKTLKHDMPSSKIWRSLYKGGKKIAIKGLEKTDPWSSVLNMKAARGKMGVYAIVRAEQAPNPRSRVMLTDATDALGMRQPLLDWQFSELDKRSVHGLMTTLADEYKRLGWGDVRLSSWLNDPEVTWKTDPLISAHPIGGYHHMGGTRMSETAETGVVNSDCRLHESPNLFVASSSVFPTGGWANPTVTIMALAQRLGDHLKPLCSD